MAKHATGGKRNKTIIGSEVMSIGDEDWAPPHGPARPLVQLMAVLPPERYEQPHVPGDSLLLQSLLSGYLPVINGKFR